MHVLNMETKRSALEPNDAFGDVKRTMIAGKISIAASQATGACENTAPTTINVTGSAAIP
jgi:hypothetical protein